MNGTTSPLLPIPKNETAQRKVLASSVSGINEIVRFLSLHFKKPENVIVSAFPYRSYAIYLARKHTSAAGADIGRYFRVTCSAVTKMGTRLKQRMEKDGTLREEMRRIETALSVVNG